jgi:GDP-L-fucose synthase
MPSALRRVLITGGRGFLGSHLVDRFRRAGYDVTAPSRADCDLTEGVAVDTLFRDTRPEIVVHAAAAVGGIGANRANPGRFFYENAMMGLNVVEAARRYHAAKVVVLGTICSYPRITPVPFREEELWNGYPEPVTAPYGIAKKAILVQCQTYREQYGLDAIFLLPVNLYGPGDHFDLENSHVIPAMMRKFVDAKEGGSDRVVLWGDGSATREFLYVEDAAEGILLATERYSGAEPVNLGTGVETSIRETAGMIATSLGFRGRIVWDTSMPNGQPRRCLDVSRAEREFGFKATTPLREGLDRTLRWYQAQRSLATAVVE